MNYQIVITEDTRESGDVIYRAYVDLIVGRTFWGKVKKDRWFVTNSGTMWPVHGFNRSGEYTEFSSFELATQAAKKAVEKFLTQKAKDTTVGFREFKIIEQ